MLSHVRILLLRSAPAPEYRELVYREDMLILFYTAFDCGLALKKDAV